MSTKQLILSDLVLGLKVSEVAKKYSLSRQYVQRLKVRGNYA